MIYKLHTIQWEVPTAHYPFEAELYAGVRTAGLLARQSPAVQEKIRAAIEERVRNYASGNHFLIPKGGAYVVAVTKDAERANALHLGRPGGKSTSNDRPLAAIQPIL